MQLKISHVFHEKKNHCIDKLINLALIHKEQYKFIFIYLFIFFYNRYSLSIFYKI